MKKQKYRDAMKKHLDCVKYYNLNRPKTYQGEYSLFIIMGGRGIGKTTNLKIDCFDDWIDNDNEFMYVRRWGKETRLQKNLMDSVIDNVQFIGDGNDGGMYMIDKQRIGWLLALANQDKYKSVDFEKVKTMVYDEAIIRRSATHRYIDNEVELFFELVSTVFRERTDYRIFVMGNNADFFNPWIEYFNIPPLKPGQIYTDPERRIYVEYASDSPAYIEANSKTPLYAITKGTPYHSYHYKNEVLLEKQVEYVKIPQSANIIMRFLFDKYTLAMYNDNGWIYVKGYKERNDEHPRIDLYRGGIPNYEIMPLMKKFPPYATLRRAYYSEDLKYANDVALALVQQIVEMVK